MSLIGIFHVVEDRDDPYGLVSAYLDALPSGSYLALSQFTADLTPEEAARAAEVYHRGGLPAVARSRDQFARFFDGLELIEPGVALVHR
nr:SAM-dependent methyltransferase [Pseudofrankia asymbiotica]